VLVPIYGKLSDLYGRRPFFLGGLVAFLAGSALAGASPDLPWLIACRAIQGVGAGAIMPNVQAIIGDLFPPAERGKWQGLTMGVWALASILGPLAGGGISDHWGWRWVFYINLPLGLAALALAGLTLPGGARRGGRLDRAGVVLLPAATVPLLLALSWAGTEHPWLSPPVLGLLALSLVLLGVLFAVERRSADPILNPALFANRSFGLSVLITFLVSGALFGALMYLPLFVQAVIGASATASGAVITPLMFGVIVSSVAGGQVLARTGRYKALALVGLAIAASGMFLLGGMGPDTGGGTVVRNMVVTGLGVGMSMTLFTIIVQNAFPARRLGEVTANLQFFREIGGTLGVAVLGAFMTARFHTDLRADLPASFTRVVPPERLAALDNPQVLLSPQALGALRQGFAAYGPAGETLLRQLTEALRLSLASVIGEVFAVAGGLILVAFLAAFFLHEIPLRKRLSAEDELDDIR
jgi:EmrB/QacA subfamily drug resistance transporter